MRTKSPDTFFICAPKLNQLNILQQLAADSHLTQADLARRCNLSVAMVNNYIKELSTLGLLQYQRVTSKSVSYPLTSFGETRLEKMRQEIIVEMVELFADLESRLLDLILGQASGTVNRVVLFGSGRLAELVLHALESASVKVIGVCADDPLLVGSEWCGRHVQNPSQINYMAPDAVVIAETARTEEICHGLKYLADRGVKLIRLDKDASRNWHAAAVAANPPLTLTS